ncbi:DUF47 family protein [Fontisphaera persica]|uniref:DUF47 domain-containing protein n=1 Tax=Fontisphaera persica TaxID=2974023 RepID=UPI0024C01BFB|nr:DUF47 family protein [Fontisphaera persica]WCJ59217.1 DUF47 family protein [Fontisphaera persica]
MISIQKLLGKDDVFYNLLEASAQEGLHSAQVLTRLLRQPQQPTHLQEFSEFRRNDKKITKEIEERLVKTFVTALEREDIESLSSALYKIPKTIEKFAERYLQIQALVKDHDFTPMARLVERAATLVGEMVKALRRHAPLEEMKDLNGRLQEVEGEADKYLLEVFKDLYGGKYEPLQVLALKELHELLEKTVDRCRDAGNTVTYIVLKHS